MAQELANIGWRHSHFAHPDRCRGSRPMGSNPANHIGLADTGELAQQGNGMIVKAQIQAIH